MKRILFVTWILATLFTACVKNTIPYIPPISDNFDWKTTEAVSISIPITLSKVSSFAISTKSQEYASTVQIYSSPLYSKGSLIASGAAYSGKAFETVMDLAKGCKEVYVKIISPNGLVSLSTFDIIGNKAVKSNAKNRFTKANIESIGEEPAIPTPNFPKKYDVTINSTSDLPPYLTGNKTYFIPAGKELEINSAGLFANLDIKTRPVLYVKGAIILTNDVLSPLSFCSIVVLNGGSVKFSGLVDINNTAENLLAIYVQEDGELIMKKGFNALKKGVSIVNKGEVHVNSPSLLGGGALLYNTGAFNFTQGINFTGAGSTCYNFGDIEAGKLTLNAGSTFYNYKNAEFDCENKLYIGSSSSFKNEGDVESENIEIFSNASFYNYNYLNDRGSVETEILTMNSTSSSLYQHGFFTVEESFYAKGKIDNYGRLECNVIRDGSTVTFNCYAGSLLKTTNLYKLYNATFYMESGSIAYIYKNGNGKGNGDNRNVKFINRNMDGQDYALILWGVSDKKPDNTIINSKDEISFLGNIENYCPKKNDSQNAKYTANLCNNSAYWGGRDHYIPETIYNEGLGSTGGKDPVDADGDGVPQGTDVDDNDPTVTHVSYFPSAGTWGTYFFEDLWPYTGDYDMNDVVLGFRIAYYTKGELSKGNNIVYIDFNWKLRAVGAGMEAACGIQLDDISPNMVANLQNDNHSLSNAPINTNNKGMELGQNDAVFALFNNPSELYGVSSWINVVHDVNGATVIPSEKNVRIRFTNSIPKEHLLINKINPFIVVSETGLERGREIHQSNYPPTDLVDKSYYGQGFVSDKDVYRANNGMVWGCMIPQEFRYMLEMQTISNGYPNFPKWYQSAGLDHIDWYNSSIPDNVVEEYLYDSEWK